MVFTGMTTGQSTAHRDLLAVALALVALLAFDASGADHALTRLYGTPQGFAWRDHWLSSGLMHEGGRIVSWVLFAVTLWAAFWPRGAASRVNPRTRQWWFGCTVACLLLIPTLKRLSVTSCPWELAEFGGSAQWLSHWAFVRDGGPGRCFPSGHASGAFSFLAGYFALRQAAPRAARQWLGFVVAIGFAFGWAQLTRGAHHASHTLWTAWICWTVTALSFHGTRHWRLAPQR
jgi:membrane-associated PAP2 superfamily phosphatase